MVYLRDALTRFERWRREQLYRPDLMARHRAVGDENADGARYRITLVRQIDSIAEDRSTFGDTEFLDVRIFERTPVDTRRAIRGFLRECGRGDKRGEQRRNNKCRDTEHVALR